MGADAIMKFIAKADGSPISRNTLANLINKGLPAVQINGTWYAHADNIDDWFRRIPMKPTRDRRDLSSEDLE